MSKKPKVPIAGRGGVSDEIRAKARAAERERALREAARTNPTDLLGFLRKTCDAQVLALKRRVAAEGMDRDHVVCLIPNPRIDPGDGYIACEYITKTRSEVYAMLEGDELAPMRAMLAHPPKPGHVWLFVPIPHQRLLIEEPFEHSVSDVATNSAGGEA